LDRAELEAHIRALSEREKKVIQLRFGLLDDHPRNFDEIGRELDLTPAEVEEIESSALSKLQTLSSDRPPPDSGDR
jgi:RNA polymerase primary sigma factor